MVGSDECGFGSWAGPLVVCAVIIPRAWPHSSRVKDSKAVRTEAKREAIAREILPLVTNVIVSVPPEDIDRNGVYKTLKWAHGHAIDQVLAKHLATGATGSLVVIVDGNMDIRYGDGEQATSVVEGDALVPAVSAASILGKVARDKTMIELAKVHPGYGFENHKGYGGGKDHAHTIALNKLGPCAIHRKSYGPVRNAMSKPSDLFDMAMSGDLD